MKVLVATPCYPRFDGDYNGGFVRDLCMRLERLGVELSVLAPRSRTLRRAVSRFPVRRFPYLPSQRFELLPESTMKGAPPWRLAQLPSYLASAFLHLHAYQTDLVHCHLAIPIGFAATIPPRKHPLIITCHGSDCTLPLDSPAYLPFTRHSISHADRVVAVSKYVERLTLRLGAKRVETIHLGVDTAKFSPPTDRRNIRIASGISEGVTVVGTLGRLVPEKRIADIIKAAKIAGTKIDIALVVGGDGPERRKLTSLAKEYGQKTFFTGAVRDAPRFHGLLDVFVLASDREGLSLSLQEAMATGCVPVATRGFGSDELVDCRTNGYTYEPGNVQQLADKIVRAANNRWLGKKARETITKGFDADEGAIRYLELYRNVAG